mmetsp:Transcript_4416/g.7091  ORF Transcript_4416/g.7091 Transcript_4416/m.7091 type:complete len:208 (-) Transcript_4416:1316-1939(-)
MHVQEVEMETMRVVDNTKVADKYLESRGTSSDLQHPGLKYSESRSAPSPHLASSLSKDDSANSVKASSLPNDALEQLFAPQGHRHDSQSNDGSGPPGVLQNSTDSKSESGYPSPGGSHRAGLLRDSCPERVRVFGNWLLETFGHIILCSDRSHRMTVDVAGGKGELAMYLELGGAPSILVDPRVPVLRRHQRKQLRRSGRELVFTEF